MSASVPAVEATGVTFRYRDRVACKDIDFCVEIGQMYAFLGPNGSGKSTLFKILATIYPLQQGKVSVLGMDLGRDVRRIRPLLGVVFQSPALDEKLTVRENLVYGGHLFGLWGAELEVRVDTMLEKTALSDRAHDRVGELSGGLRRRTELAKGLLPEPRLLLLDEPSNGLDLGARHDLWRFIRSLDGVTVLYTTHLMDEAERADRVAILRQGLVVADGAPAELKRELGEQVLELECSEPDALALRIADLLDCDAVPTGRGLRIERDDGHLLVPHLVEHFGAEISRLTLSHPSLEDVYIRLTGHRFWVDGEGEHGP